MMNTELKIIKLETISNIREFEDVFVTEFDSGLVIYNSSRTIGRYILGKYFDISQVRISQDRTELKFPDDIKIGMKSILEYSYHIDSEKDYIKRQRKCDFYSVLLFFVWIGLFSTMFPFDRISSGDFLFGCVVCTLGTHGVHKMYNGLPIYYKNGHFLPVKADLFKGYFTSVFFILFGLTPAMASIFF